MIKKHHVLNFDPPKWPLTLSNDNHLIDIYTVHITYGNCRQIGSRNWDTVYCSDWCISVPSQGHIDNQRRGVGRGRVWPLPFPQACTRWRSAAPRHRRSMLASDPWRSQCRWDWWRWVCSHSSMASIPPHIWPCDGERWNHRALCIWWSSEFLEKNSTALI